MTTGQIIIPSKIRVVYIAIFVMAALLGIFSVRWQIVEASRFTDAAQGRIGDALIPSLRGAIYAKDGSTLAYSEPRWDVHIWIPGVLYVERKDLQTREEFTTKLSPLLDMSPERLNEIINSSQASGHLYPKVATALNIEKIDAIKALTRKIDGAALVGYDLKFTSKRIYPEGRLASQIIGLTNVLDSGKTIGQGGLEGEWNGYLEPIVGYIQGERDARGNAISLATARTIEAKRGSSVYTTIDKKLQAMVEEKLEWAVGNYGAKSGTVVIMDPKTGHIMALANYPDYDPNLREERDLEAYGNKAVSEPFEIGSVGKIWSLAAAIDSGTITPQSVILENGHEGCVKIHEDLEPVCTHDKLPQPAISIADAFALSDNIYFLNMADLMEKKDKGSFYQYLDKFGIGRPSGVDLAGESFGFLKNWEYWNIADIAAYSYGHSYQVNSVQATSAVAAIANYGVRMQPRIVSKVVEATGREVAYSPQPLDQVVSRQTVAQMDEMMHVVYLNNIFWWEGQYNDLRNYKIALKSGTALIPYRDRAGYSNAINATYIGYDASPSRTFVMLTRLEDPKEGNLASQNSRVLWLEIFREMKDYLSVPRKGSF